MVRYKDWTERSKKCSQCLKKTKNKQKNNQKDLDEACKSIAQTNLKKTTRKSHSLEAKGNEKAFINFCTVQNVNRYSSNMQVLHFLVVPIQSVFKGDEFDARRMEIVLLFA